MSSWETKDRGVYMEDTISVSLGDIKSTDCTEYSTDIGKCFTTVNSKYLFVA